MHRRRLFWLVFAVMAIVTAVIQFVPADGPGPPAAESDPGRPQGQAQGQLRRTE